MSWYGKTRAFLTRSGSARRCAISSVMPGCSKTPWRANVFRFMRVICQGARRAMAVHSFVPRSSAVNIWNGTSGTTARSPALNASNSRTSAGSAAASYSRPTR